MIKSAAVLSILVAAACSAKVTSQSGNGSAGPGSAAAAAPSAAADPSAALLPKDLPAAFAAWDMAARAKAFQGAHTMEESLGFYHAIDVQGTTVKQWDGKTEKTLSLALTSPCSADITETTASGSSSTTTVYTLEDGKLIAGLGNAGARKGKTAVACVFGSILTLDDAGKCTEWSNSFHHWESKPGTCALTQKDGKDVFTAHVADQDYTLAANGDALLDDQMANTKGKAFADFTAAKAARDAK